MGLTGKPGKPGIRVSTDFIKIRPNFILQDTQFFKSDFVRIWIFFFPLWSFIATGNEFDMARSVLIVFFLRYCVVCFPQGVKGREGSEGLHGSPGEKVSGLCKMNQSHHVTHHMMTKCNAIKS